MAAEAGSDGGLEWAVTVPVLANRFMWWDMAKVFVLCMALMIAGFGLAFVLYEKPIKPSTFYLVIAYMTLLLAGCLVLTMLLLAFVHRKGYTLIFSINHDGVFMAHAAKTQAAINGLIKIGMVAAAANRWYGVGELLAKHEAKKGLGWDQVQRVAAHPDDRVITLGNKWVALMRIYCPDREIFRLALGRVAAHCPGLVPPQV